MKVQEWFFLLKWNLIKFSRHLRWTKDATKETRSKINQFPDFPDAIGIERIRIVLLVGESELVGFNLKSIT